MRKKRATYSFLFKRFQDVSAIDHQIENDPSIAIPEEDQGQANEQTTLPGQSNKVRE